MHVEPKTGTKVHRLCCHKDGTVDKLSNGIFSRQGVDACTVV